MPTLGEEIKRIRELKGFSLREVEKRTNRKVSNSYLSLIESGKVKEPSPNVLYALATVYGVPYRDLMKLAEYIVPASENNGTDRRVPVALMALKDLTPKQWDEVVHYVNFMKRRKRKQ